MSREEQVKKLFSLISSKVSLFGNSVLSLGCGNAPEKSFLSHDFKRVTLVDHNSDNIQANKSNVQFVHSEAMYFCSRTNEKYDLILALDIDSNILPVLLIEQALRVLQKKGTIVITERENNINIYGRMLLLPHVTDIMK